MSTLIQTKTNFTAGELAPELLGRGDLRAYDNGAARLRNVFIQPTGGVTRRAGLRHIDSLLGTGRLIAFEFNTEQVYLLALTANLVSVFMDGALVASFAAPWSEADLPEVVWTQSADSLIVVHPDVEPRLITRTSHTDWSIGLWPLARPPETAIEGVRMITDPGYPTTVWTDVAFFTNDHLGVMFRVDGQFVRITQITHATRAEASIVNFTPTGTYDGFTECHFSPRDGWPKSITFHQDRLVIGGTRSKPNHIWFSRSGAFFDFHPGDGLDDEGIDFTILSDQVNAIHHVFSGRHLQVFTAGAEWTVEGEPLTPSNIRVRRQTRVGTPAGRRVPPRDVAGATLFAAASGRELREFVFSDVEQAYQASDLALLARHLFNSPQDMDYDPVRRLVHVVMADGTLATVTNFRRENVTAWTLQETAGALRAVAVAGGETYVITERDDRFAIERFADSLATDAALSGTADTAKATWSGLDHLDGAQVRVLADGVDVGTATVSGGSIVLAEPAVTVEVGLPFVHVVEPLPPSPDGPRGGGNGRQVRLIRASFRLLETPVLQVDTGGGATSLSFKRFAAQGVLDSPPPSFTGDATVRAIGWQRDAVKPLWTVTQDTPLPCTILSVTTEIKVTD